MSDSVWPHGLQHARLPCPSLSPRVRLNSCALSRWCQPTISSSVAPLTNYYTQSSPFGLRLSVLFPLHRHQHARTPILHLVHSCSSGGRASAHFCPSASDLLPAAPCISASQPFLQLYFSSSFQDNSLFYISTVRQVRGHPQLSKWMNEMNKWRTFWFCCLCCFHYDTRLAYLAQMVFISTELIFFYCSVLALSLYFEMFC